ncbi:glycosyltransferase [Streptacidiphilus melanogenes]|uniref:glycosyltransferase n=1 Tax=Streptacidiphilus melanogenes TaxID=411235 RepID=UPI001364A06E|nr:glycosyltransferase family 2 protein [Streptacidiphilus melanogenes]
MTPPTQPTATTGSVDGEEEPAGAPVHVLELDLAVPGSLRFPGETEPRSPQGRLQVLVRLHGHPVGWVRATANGDDPDTLYESLAESARKVLSVPARPPRAPETRPSEQGPLVSVIVCTRDRTAMLPACLDSLLRLSYPRLEILLVDNAPSDDTTRELVLTRYGDRIRYLREPAPGLSWARNCGLAEARGEICAFTDDDVIVDDEWISALTDVFEADHRVACVTGFIAPAELDTEAQLVIEAYAPAGRGFAPQTWSLRGAQEDPMVQFSAGRFGCGANMAFRTEVLRGFRGFDRATGTGSPARGGEDLLAFQQVLTAGHTIAYQPDAVVWHRHRRSMDALVRQVGGFGIGFSAYLTAAVVRRPRLLLVLLRRLPTGAWRWHQASQGRAQAAASGYQEIFRLLKRRERRGFLLGPICYLESVRRQRSVARAGGRE